MKAVLKYLLVNLILICLSADAFAQDTLVTVQYDMNRCVRLYLGDEPLIATNRETLDSIIRKGASKERCQEMLGGFDIDHFSLLGINLNSGYCREPEGLDFRVIKIDAEKKYIVEISYDDPIGICRALSSYNLWMKVPALSAGYEVEFMVSSRKRE